HRRALPHDANGDLLFRRVRGEVRGDLADAGGKVEWLECRHPGVLPLAAYEDSLDELEDPARLSLDDGDALVFLGPLHPLLQKAGMPQEDVERSAEIVRADGQQFVLYARSEEHTSELQSRETLV